MIETFKNISIGQLTLDASLLLAGMATIIQIAPIKINPWSALAKAMSALRMNAADGVNLALGTDGAASNNGQDMIELMKTAAMLQKVNSLDPTIITAEKVLEMATIDGARAIGMEDEIGSLEVGKDADLVLTNGSPFEISTRVQCVLIDGKMVYQTL